MTLPSAGSQTLAQVCVLMRVLTIRTLPSHIPTIMVPAMACGRDGSQSYWGGATWNSDRLS